MPRFKEYPWWPTTWEAQAGQKPTPEKISRGGLLRNVRLLGRHDLSFVVDHKGATYTATVTPNLPEDTLILVRHILLQQWGEPMNVVEEIELGFDGPFPFVVK